MHSTPDNINLNSYKIQISNRKFKDFGQLRIYLANVFTTPCFEQQEEMIDIDCKLLTVNERVRVFSSQQGITQFKPD